MPLKDVMVLEFVGLAPGPFCGKILADFGASVLRIDKINMDADMPLAPTPTIRSTIHVPRPVAAPVAAALVAAGPVAAPRTTTSTGPRSGTRALPSTLISAAEPQCTCGCTAPFLKVCHHSKSASSRHTATASIVWHLPTLPRSVPRQTCARYVCGLTTPCCTEPPDPTSVNNLVATTVVQYDNRQ
ncbi:uncharacterized protein LOC126765067 isoform X3 [Bactrocera neohumeralis]|uniref:uncharacterized protein LOC126765067 isoform X3 n=1 Tax=Bactrocera neohumeralis TaxID=98809 RepID=UPI0021652BBA|nr:uncharacterized protein LOC126765067 isoform X3 [Bactrocera neohumeralis]